MARPWSTFDELSVALREIDAEVWARGERRRVRFRLPPYSETAFGPVQPTPEERKPAFRDGHVRPAYWRTLDECIEYLRAASEHLAADGRRAWVSISLPFRRTRGS